jgi:hypothetical protein
MVIGYAFAKRTKYLPASDSSSSLISVVYYLAIIGHSLGDAGVITCKQFWHAFVWEFSNAGNHTQHDLDTVQESMMGCKTFFSRFVLNPAIFEVHPECATM